MGIGTFLLQITGAGVIGFFISNALADPIGSFKNGSVFVCDNLSGVWVLIDGEKREVPDENIFVKLGLNLAQVIKISCELVNSIPDGPPLNENDKEVIDQTKT